MRDLSNEFHHHVEAPHRHAVRVYYEDTDLAGIVYYANYLKYIERARSEVLRTLDFDQRNMKAESGHVFAVRHLEADYLSPAFFDDMLDVQTSLVSLSRVRIVVEQQVFRGTDLLFTAKVTLVCLDARGRPARLPARLVHAVSQNCAC